MSRSTICHSCLSISGEERISPGETIFAGRYWLVEHAYPSGLEGWLVIVLKRHCEKLHQLSSDEWLELSTLQQRCCKVLKTVFKSSKEYTMCFAEGQGFKHIHFHVVPKHSGFDKENSGAKAFNYLKMPQSRWVSKPRVREICRQLKRKF